MKPTSNRPFSNAKNIENISDGVLCMIFYAYSNDLVSGNMNTPGDVLLINWSTYVQSLCKF